MFMIEPMFKVGFGLDQPCDLITLEVTRSNLIGLLETLVNNGAIEILITTVKSLESSLEDEEKQPSD